MLPAGRLFFSFFLAAECSISPFFCRIGSLHGERERGCFVSLNHVCIFVSACATPGVKVKVFIQVRLDFRADVSFGGAEIVVDEE